MTCQTPSLLRHMHGADHPATIESQDCYVLVSDDGINFPCKNHYRCTYNSDFFFFKFWIITDACHWKCISIFLSSSLDWRAPAYAFQIDNWALLWRWASAKCHKCNLQLKPSFSVSWWKGNGGWQVLRYKKKKPQKAKWSARLLHINTVCRDFHKQH